MFDLESILPKENCLSGDHDGYINLAGSTVDSHAMAAQENMLIIMATISNNLERIADVQEGLLSGGKEAIKKTDESMAAVTQLMATLKGGRS